MSAGRHFRHPETVAASDLDDGRIECSACEGSGRIPRGAFGPYYRDGECYDAPGEEVCEACDGEGSTS